MMSLHILTVQSTLMCLSRIKLSCPKKCRWLKIIPNFSLFLLCCPISLDNIMVILKLAVPFFCWITRITIVFWNTLIWIKKWHDLLKWKIRCIFVDTIDSSIVVDFPKSITVWINQRVEITRSKAKHEVYFILPILKQRIHFLAINTVRHPFLLLKYINHIFKKKNGFFDLV